MSEPKETESGEEAQAEAAAEGAETSPSDVESSSEAEEGTADTSAEGSADATPKKKKKKKREDAEPENIRDRNARVRAEAADKRRSRREREQGVAPRRNLDAGEVVDDALARSTHAAAGFLTKHFNKVQWAIMLGLVGWIGWEVYSWRHARTTEKATDALFKALAAETGKVGSGDEDINERGGPSDTRRSFASDDLRLKAAKSEYQLASTSISAATAVLADLGAAGIAYDLGQYKEAEAAFEKVKLHPAFATDNDIKGRTLEGLGMSLEAQKNDDAAIKAFHQLSNMDVANFAALGMYHEARLRKAQGKNDDALKLLEKAGEKLATLKETPAVIKYIGGSVMELLESLDPAKARELSSKLMSSDALKKMSESATLPGGQKLSPEMQKKLQEIMELQKTAPKPAPGAPAPMPGPVAPQDAPTDGAPAPAPSGGQ